MGVFFSIIIIIIIWEFFTSALADGLSLEFEWQQVLSSLHIIIIIIILIIWEFFYICYNRWFSTGVWETASLLKSPGLILIFWQISKILKLGWTPLAPF